MSMIIVECKQERRLVNKVNMEEVYRGVVYFALYVQKQNLSVACASNVEKIGMLATDIYSSLCWGKNEKWLLPGNGKRRQGAIDSKCTDNQLLCGW